MPFFSRRSVRSLTCALALLPALCFGEAAAEHALIKYVDPFMGVEGGGNTVPGAAVPFGFVRLSPDTANALTSGYNPVEDIIGFSHTHVSGTGGQSKYGNFRVTPQVGALEVGEVSSPKSNESASPGYYTVTLTRPNVKVELTATHWAGLHRYTFPASTQAHLLLDVTAIVSSGREPYRQRVHLCSARMTSPTRIEGTVNALGGWNPGTYTLHFAAELDRKPSAFGTWLGDRIDHGRDVIHGRGATGMFFTFDTTADPVVRLKMGLSFLSAEKARAHLDSEIAGWDFEAVRRAAEATWEDVLSKLQVEGGTNDQRSIFYTAAYRAHYMPHDVTGENAWWSSSEPHYEDYYCIWDTFRTLHPLLTLIQPERQPDMVRSLVDTYVHTGWMPDARIAGTHGLNQGGSNADVVIADAIVKGMKGFDYKTAYESMLKNAEVDSPNPLQHGREVSEYKRLGYMTTSFARSASRTMEYAYNDFCVGLVANALGKKKEAQKYFERSKGWRGLWDAELKSIRPKHADGRWLEPFSPTHNYPDKEYGFWDAPFYEGNGWQYSTYVPHDPQALINLLGGDEPFVAWLDRFFDEGVYEMGNEPDILAPYLYIHASRPDRTAERVRALLNDKFKTGRAGLPGNDDAGAMSSWYMWGTIGLYPNAGQDFYYVGSPVFSRARIDLGGGRTFVIEAPDTSDANKYVQSATLNGQPLERAWVRHSDIARGGRLALRMGPQPSSWGREPRPPSLSAAENRK